MFYGEINKTHYSISYNSLESKNITLNLKYHKQMGYAEDRPLLTHFLGGKTQRPRSPTATLYKSNDQSLHANLNTHVQCYRQGNKTEVEREREITIFYKEKVPQTMFSVQASIIDFIT